MANDLMIQIATIRMTSMMCDNAYTLKVYLDGNLLNYVFYAGHAHEGTPRCMSDLDPGGHLPDVLLEGENYRDIVGRIAHTLIERNLCQTIVKTVIKTQK